MGSVLFVTVSKPALEPILFRIQCVPRASSMWVKHLAWEANHSPLSVTEEEEWTGLYPLFPPIYLTSGRILINKAQRTFNKSNFIWLDSLPVGQGLLIVEDSRSHSDTPHSVWLLWTSDRPVAETSTWQNTTFTTDRHPWLLQDSNPQSQQASGGRPTPYRRRGHRTRQKGK